MAIAEELDLANPPFPLTAIDRELLAMRDEDFHRITWEDLQAVISANKLEELKRSPNDLHRYLRWSHETKQSYGSITNFVVRKRLGWSPLLEVSDSNPLGANSFSRHSAVPFQDDRDYRILINDWPYGFTPGITHIVVWSRTPIPVDAVRGDVTAETRELIQAFVHDRFVRIVASDEQVSNAAAAQRVVWFKNWVSLQSVRGVDHIHVLVKDVSPALLQRWTAR